MGHKGTPRDRDTIANKLKPIQEASADLSVVLVWDGRTGQDAVAIEKMNDAVTSGKTSSLLQVVSLAEGMSTDDYILQQLEELKAAEDSKSSSVQVVTADRALRRQVLQAKPVIRGVVNPVVFWKRYRPRLTGMKSDYKNEPKDPEATP